MTTIEVAHLSERAHEVLRGRAAAAGASLPDYVRDQLEQLAARPTVEEVLERAARHSGGSFTLRQAAADVRAKRDSR